METHNDQVFYAFAFYRNRNSYSGHEGTELIVISGGVQLNLIIPPVPAITAILFFPLAIQSRSSLCTRNGGGICLLLAHELSRDA